MTQQSKSLRQRALDYLAKREYSYAELGKKLKAYAEESDNIPALLNDFKMHGWLSDARYTDQIVHARQAKFGSARIANELREKGVADALIADAIAKVKVSDLDNAREIWRKKFNTTPQSRGFGFDVIKKVLNAKEIEAQND